MAFDSLIDVAGYVAAALVFLTFSMKTLMSLRSVAIASNVAFLTYGFMADLTPILILHGLLLPLNLYRAWEHQNLLNRIENALESSAGVELLLPHMTKKRVHAGTALFEKGDAADRLYYVLSGRVRIQEWNTTLGSGSLIGEMGLFTPTRVRTATVVADADTDLCWIGYEAVLLLCKKHPEFALLLSRLAAHRMVQNQTNLLQRVADAQGDGQPNRQAE
ncbi:MAG: cyclic nucleotide-binding domain-containing protein [Pseudomonadota bacterium]